MALGLKSAAWDIQGSKSCKHIALAVFCARRLRQLQVERVYGHGDGCQRIPPRDSAGTAGSRERECAGPLEEMPTNFISCGRVVRQEACQGSIASSATRLLYKEPGRPSPFPETELQRPSQKPRSS